MPEEIMIIIIVSIIAGTISSIVRSIMGVAKARAQSPATPGSSLTTSELQRMLQAAVAEGNTRIEARFDELEARLDRLEGQEPLGPSTQARIDPRLLDDEPPDAVTSQRRSRTT